MLGQNVVGKTFAATIGNLVAILEEFVDTLVQARVLFLQRSGHYRFASFIEEGGSGQTDIPRTRKHQLDKFLLLGTCRVSERLLDGDFARYRGHKNCLTQVAPWRLFRDVLSVGQEHFMER